MEISHEKTACIGFGYSTLADAFQAGREAAQMAKSQVPDRAADLAIAVSPGDIHFKDFIEGVRLVTGEGSLIGIPSPWVFLTDAPNTRSRAVLIMQADDQRMTLVSTPEERNPLVTITSLMTDLRSRRGNARQDFDFHGMIIVDNMVATDRGFFAHHLSGDAGLESGLTGFSLWPSQGASMVCGSHTVGAGVAAIEYLSNGPWGVGWVETSSFPDETAVKREAARASMRDALAQLQSRRPSAGMLLVASSDQPFPEDEALELVRMAGSVVPGLPLIGMPVRFPYLREHGRSTNGAREGIISLLVTL